MNDKILSIIKSIIENKKLFLELLVMDIISLTITLFLFIACVFIIFALANLLNINSSIPFDIKTLLIKFALVWYFITVIITLFIHAKTIMQININGQRMILEDE